MIRAALVLLLLANALFFAWTQGLLLGIGLAPATSSEPQRVAQQIQPEALRVVSAEESRPADAAQAATPRPTECLLAGPVDEIAGQMLRQALQAWPAGSWVLEPVLEPARPELRGQLLRLPAVDDALRARLDDVRPALGGSPLRPCRQP